MSMKLHSLLPEEKGDQFEQYVQNLISYKNNRFQIKQWRRFLKTKDGCLPLDMLSPDLEIGFRTDQLFDHTFLIECKWRQRLYKDHLDWSNEKQLQRYQQYYKQTKFPFFIALGLGGIPKDPEEFFLAPFQEIASTPRIHRSELKKYKRPKRNRFYYSPNQLKLF